MALFEMTTAPHEDTDLVRRALEGDGVAFEHLVERYQGRLFALARNYTKVPAEVEDIVQDTFLKAYTRLDSFQHQSSFYTWVYRIATNTLLDFLKRRGRSPVQAVEDPELVAPAGGDQPMPRPDAELEQRERERVRLAVLLHVDDRLQLGLRGAGAWRGRRDARQDGAAHLLLLCPVLGRHALCVLKQRGQLRHRVRLFEFLRSCDEARKNGVLARGEASRTAAGPAGDPLG